MTSLRMQRFLPKISSSQESTKLHIWPAHIGKEAFTLPRYAIFGIVLCEARFVLQECVLSVSTKSNLAIVVLLKFLKRVEAFPAIRPKLSFEATCVSAMRCLIVSDLQYEMLLVP